MKINLAIFLVCIGACSCTNPPKNEKPIIETPKALQENSTVYSEIKSSRGGVDLVEDLYQELVDKDPKLKELEDQIAGFDQRKLDSFETFQKFDQKNNSYYQAAIQHYGSISDSATKWKIKELVLASQVNYKNRTSYIQTLIQQINKNEVSLNDLHTLLKIVKTMEMMERYQKENAPSAKPIEAIGRDLKKMIDKTDSLSGIK